MTTKTKQSETPETSWPEPPESEALQAQPETEVRIDPLEGYRAVAEKAAEEGRAFQPVDQRTGRILSGAGNPTAAQRKAELQAQAAAEEAEVDAFIETIKLAVGDPAPYAGTSHAVDQRKAKDLLRAALERIAAQQEDSGRSSLARRGLERIDRRDGVVKAGVGLRW